MSAGDGKKSCIRNRVRNRIVARILDGTYAAGTRLKEMALASEFEVSQAPVREALRELESLGLVESKPYCGCTVRSADEADLREAYELKMVLEQHAAMMAVPCASADVDLLDAEVAHMRDAAARQDMEAFAVATLAFHRQVMVMSGNRQFLKVWDSLLWPVRSRVATQRSRTNTATLAENCGVIADALRADDGPRAGQLLHDMIREFIDQYGAPSAG